MIKFDLPIIYLWTNFSKYGANKKDLQLYMYLQCTCTCTCTRNSIVLPASSIRTGVADVMTTHNVKIAISVTMRDDVAQIILNKNSQTKRSSPETMKTKKTVIFA